MSQSQTTVPPGLPPAGPRQAGRIDVVPATPAIGAEIRGLDLSIELSDSQFERLNQAFLDYQIIFFRDQDLSSQ